MPCDGLRERSFTLVEEFSQNSHSLYGFAIISEEKSVNLEGGRIDKCLIIGAVSQGDRVTT